MRTGVKVGVIGGVIAVVVGGGGYGAYNVLDAVNSGSSTSDTASSGAGRTGPVSADEVQETSKAFFAAWSKGKSDAAAHLTDNATKAEPSLSAFSGAAHITKARITPGETQGETVPFSVSATVSYDGKHKPLSYRSELTVVRPAAGGRAVVKWEPTVVHPKLGKGDWLKAGVAEAPTVEAVDRDGRPLDVKKYPSLAPVLDTLRERYAVKAGGTPGIELSVVHADERAPETLVTLSEGKPGKVRTTLSASAQAAAEQAVAQYGQSSVVAEKPSTGEILAVANHRNDNFNAAFLGRLAPGSTMKMVTAAMLIDKGLVSADSKAPCPATATWQSQTFHNLAGMAPDENATLASSFARSCNTTFVKMADDVEVDDLTREAEDNFGLGKNWKTGIVSFDGRVPATGGPDTAASLIGQGQVQMNPLNLVSVTSTVRAGSFRQPVLVPQSLDGRKLAKAKGLSSKAAGQVRQMMNRTATSGTGAPAMAGLGGDIGAKTGSAEVDGQQKANSWFAGYRDDVAAAAMAQEGGHGGDTAGPIVAAVLRAGR
ncbi:penicillin-binding transpeptidase domain-containing protein [Streptomyces tsukubensis]|uniref:Penicillin-binding protein n=1 Tax=Streptomyces tsukubensis TaxID=83656 RepID=A0A1V4A5G4_9ACTN|nr:penicillin-binding transpeptidase domain-containing protein [Streptomyces tsukubensis]OON75971.1 penicillin-binding protein [Streptomyces tsukubensis]QFR94062.1 penicillin-binding protein [Streptomyces tsukubensis]